MESNRDSEDGAAMIELTDQNNDTASNGRRKSVEVEPLVSAADEDESVESGLDSHGMPLSGTASNRQVVINIIISFVGAGLLGIPYAFLKSGWLLGSIALCCMSAANVYAMLLLPAVRQRLSVMQQRRSVPVEEPSAYDNEHDKDGIVGPGNETKVESYGDVARLLLGPTGELAVNISLAVSQTGFATAYIIFIAANLLKLARVPRGLTCLFCIPGLSIMVQARDMRTLAYSSIFANLANLLGLSSVLFVDVETLERPHPADIEGNTVYAIQWSGLLTVMAVTLYSMEGVGLILSLEQSCHDPRQFPMLLSRTVGSITLFMAVFGCAGYWAFRAHTQAPITLNLGSSSVAAAVIQSALCFALYLTYAVMMFPVWKIAQDKCLTSDNWLHKALLRVAVVCSTALVAYAVPNFGEFLSLVGSSLCTLLGFVFPCYFHQQVFGDERPPWQRRLDSFLLLGGIVFGVFGTFQSFLNLMSKNEGEP